MDTRLLDVLHDAAEVEVTSVVERIDVDLDGVVEEAVDQHRMLGIDLCCAHEVVAQHRLVVDDLHAATTEDIGGPDKDRVADLLSDSAGLIKRERRAEARRWQRCASEQGAELGTVLGQVDRCRGGAHDRHARVLQALGQAERSLPAELDDDAGQLAARGFGMDDLEHVLKRERLEVEPIGGVVVGRDGLGIAVDHDGLVTGLAQSQRRMHTGVVELDALPDAVRPRAEDDHLASIARLDLCLLVVRRVVIWRARSELSRAGVDRLEDGADPPVVSLMAHLGLRHADQARDLRVREAMALGLAHQVGLETSRSAQAVGEVVDDLDLGEEPGVDARRLVHLLEGRPRPQRLLDLPEPPVMGGGNRGHERGTVDVCWPGEDRIGALEGTQCLLQCLGEVAADRHRLSDRLHGRRERGIRLGELLEGEARDLDHDVVEGGLEGRRRLAGDVVGDLVQGVADGESSGNLCDGEARGLRRER